MIFAEDIAPGVVLKEAEELDACSIGTVIVDSEGDAFQKWTDREDPTRTAWYLAGTDRGETGFHTGDPDDPFDIHAIMQYGPFCVLWTTKTSLHKRFREIIEKTVDMAISLGTMSGLVDDAYQAFVPETFEVGYEYTGE